MPEDCRHWKVAGCYLQQEWQKKFFSIGPWSAFCAGSCFYFGISFTLVLLKLHAKDPSHSAQSAGDSQLAPLVTGFSQFAVHSFTVSVQLQPAITSVRVNSLKHWQSCCCLDPEVPCTPILVTGMASAALAAAMPCPGTVTQISCKGQRSTEKREKVNE